jgi:hypothetical protein
MNNSTCMQKLDHGWDVQIEGSKNEASSEDGEYVELSGESSGAGAVRNKSLSHDEEWNEEAQKPKDQLLKRYQEYIDFL